jgi:hypothetical protein
MDSNSHQLESKRQFGSSGLRLLEGLRSHPSRHSPLLTIHRLPKYLSLRPKCLIL